MRRRWVVNTSRWIAAGLMFTAVVAWPVSHLYSFVMTPAPRLAVGVVFGEVFLTTPCEPLDPKEELVPGVQVSRVESFGWAPAFWAPGYTTENGPFEGWVPLWTIAAALALISASLWWAPIRARLRGRRDTCLSCGYPRRGLASDAPCPECGAAAKLTPTP